jgi:hypothetical protein
VGIRDVRLLSVLAAGALAAMVCVLATRVAGVGAGVCAGLVVALGGQYVTYGESLRAYALFTALAVALALCVLRAAEAPSRGRLAVIVVVVAAGILTHYYFALSCAAAVCWLWLDPAGRAVRVRATTAIAVGCAAFLPWLPDAVQQYRNQRFWWIGPFSPRNVIAVPLRLHSFAFSNTQAGRLLAFVVFLGVASSCVVVARRSAAGRIVVAFAAVPILIAAAAWASGMKVWALRNLIETGPFAATAVAAALAALPRRALAFAASGLLVGLLAVSLATSEPDRVPGYDDIAQALVAAGWTPETPIAVAETPLRYRGPIEWYLPGRPVLVPIRATGRCPRVLLVEASGRVVAERSASPGGALFAAAGHVPGCARRTSFGNAALA